MAKIIAIANQKGGVGKTTTSINLSACIAEAGKRVLLIDSDPQGNSTSGLGVNKTAVENSIYDVIINELDMADATVSTMIDTLKLVPSSIALAGAEVELVSRMAREQVLKNALLKVKDNYDYAGYPTTNGYSRERAYIATENAYAVDRLLDEGAVIIGKTNMSTEAQSAADSLSFAIGETYNAYSRELSPGGSSGGTAVAVSLKMAAAGLGSDTNSSLRLPAAYNGDVTLRSTTGLVSTEGIVPLSRSRDVAGAITRNVEDLAVMMDVLTDREHNYREALRDDALEGVRIGVVRELSYAGCGSMYAGLVDEEVDVGLLQLLCGHFLHVLLLIYKL